MKTEKEILEEIEETEKMVRSYQSEIKNVDSHSLSKAYGGLRAMDKSKIAALKWVLDI